MSRGSRTFPALASAMLVAVALAAAPEAADAQGAMGAAALDRERRAAQAQRLQHVRIEQRTRMEQARAHAQMPDTMYASTPDPSTPPHPFPLDVGLKSTPERSGSPPGMSARSAMLQTHRIGLFPSDGNALGHQGFARVINHSESNGEVEIDAWDDDGNHYGPLTLDIDAGQTVHFNSEDLETGNTGKGLDGATGPPAKGDWRLALSSTLDLQVLSYIRTEDGFLTSMHDFVARTEAGQHRVAIFNPGKNTNQESRLRLTNPGAEPTEVRIEGVDDAGQSPGETVVFMLDDGATRTLSAKDLEDGTGVSGGLGTGKGKWRLVVSADAPIEVLNTLSTPTGHLTNLSTAPGYAESDDDATHRIGLFPSAGDAQGRQGFARVINHSESNGEVDIDAWDDDGTHYGPLTLTIDAGETVHFNSDDLETGNAEKELEGATGPPAKGDWRLALSSTLDLQVLSYIRTEDGFLTSMHDFVARTEAGQHRVAIFNPGKNTNQESRLRLINPGTERTEVRIEGVDDKGQSPGETVVFTLDGGVSRTFSAKDLEDGTGVSGGLGTGKGKWRLVVSADAPIEVLNTLSTPTGHLTNLSTVPGPAVAAETAADVFAERISGPIVQGKCIACHIEGGVSGNTRLVFVPDTDPDHEALNLQVFKDFLTEAEAENEDGAGVIRNKIQGVAHGGGVQVADGTPEFADMERFLGLLGEDVKPVTLTPQTLFDTVTMASPRKTLRRAAIIFAGRTPTDAEYAAAERGADALRATIRRLMEGPAFHEFLIRGANDRLLTDKTAGEPLINHESDVQFVNFINEAYRRKKSAYETGNPSAILEFWEWNANTMYGLRRAPLELIAHVVKNNRPYTDILTANYVMANSWAAKAYGAETRFSDSGDVHEFKPSKIAEYYRRDEGLKAEHDPHLMATQILDPGSLGTVYPHAGILNTKVFLQRYPTTATNRNRARSRWTYYHFLGLDIEKSASRTTDPVALADTNNPTMHNPACTVCHVIMDPVAGAYQNYGDEGLYRDQWGGFDSLDALYKEVGGREIEVQADSRENPMALFWPLLLTVGDQRLMVAFTNDLGGPSGHVHLDRLRVIDAQGGVVVNRELETMEPPVAPWGPCGAKRNDHFELWDSSTYCRLYIDIKVPSDGTYSVEVVAWGDRGKQYGQHGNDRFAKLTVVANAYQHGDTWYRDMRTPGFSGKRAPNPDNSVQWLAKQIVADERFAEATVKFWWPAIMGTEVAEPPEDEGDANFEGLLLAANAQGAEVTRLSDGFRRGFQGRAAYNLADLLVEIVLSKWFRADAVEDADPVRNIALRNAGARRLLTPEELVRKTAALTGMQWGRQTPISGAHRGELSALAGDYRLLYGGIDSDGITQRSRDITSVMAGVAKRHAAVVSCPIVMRDFYLVPEAERRLFSETEINARPDTAGENAIRDKLVELHEILLGVAVTPQSPDVEVAYRLFVDEVERARRAHDTHFNPWACGWARDQSFFDGILDGAVIEYQNNETGWRWYNYDWDLLNDFLNGREWTDPHHTARAWVVVLAYLLMDYRYLYL